MCHIFIDFFFVSHAFTFEGNLVRDRVENYILVVNIETLMYYIMITNSLC